MLTAERRRSILQTLQREGKVYASELSKLLQVKEGISIFALFGLLTRCCAKD
jgi:hypothetical protein